MLTDLVTTVIQLQKKKKKKKKKTCRGHAFDGKVEMQICVIIIAHFDVPAPAATARWHRLSFQQEVPIRTQNTAH